MLLMTTACLPASAAQCEIREVGGLTFSNCPDQAHKSNSTGRFEPTKPPLTGHLHRSGPVQADSKDTLRFEAISPLPAVISETEIENARVKAAESSRKNQSNLPDDNVVEKPKKNSGNTGKTKSKPSQR